LQEQPERHRTGQQPAYQLLAQEARASSWPTLDARAFEMSARGSPGQILSLSGRYP
jgi:hypothetical protein